ncbi:MAG TPA: hypothetical protein ENK83_02980 [Aliiroseovarius sp.]|nr:hypothetical protein [Aliiroseovarius sp.]
MSSDLTNLAPLAQGLSLLIRLHDREVDQELIAGLREHDAAGLFAALLPEASADVADELATALADLPDPVDDATLDLLAAEFADVYLTHGYRIAPTGSVWLTEEKLERQEPMFAVREWYEHYGLSVPEWKIRSDDHLVHEMQFVAHLLGLGSEDAARDAARFMDRHMLTWMPQFFELMAERCEQPLMSASARLTAAYLQGLRDALEAVTGEARWEPEEGEKVIPYGIEQLEEDVAFIPGVAESW